MMLTSSPARDHPLPALTGQIFDLSRRPIAIDGVEQDDAPAVSIADSIWGPGSGAGDGDDSGEGEPENLLFGSFEHDSGGRVSKQIDAAGREIDYTHNAAGRVSSITQDEQTWSMIARRVQGFVDVSITGYDSAHKADVSYLLA